MHANVPWTFGPLRYAIASPAFHRWHHATEEEGLSRNFAGLFPFFDLVFGTFHMPRGAARGASAFRTATSPRGIWRQLRYPLERRPRADLARCRLQATSRPRPGNRRGAMKQESVVFLYDVDNTLLDNDRVAADLQGAT